MVSSNNNWDVTPLISNDRIQQIRCLRRCTYISCSSIREMVHSTFVSSLLSVTYFRAFTVSLDQILSNEVCIIYWTRSKLAMSNRLGKKKSWFMIIIAMGNNLARSWMKREWKKETEIIIMEQRKNHFRGMFSNQCCLQVYTIVGPVKKNENI